MENAIIRLEDIRKIYQMGGEDVYALAGISIGVQKGSFWAVMGSSGSGKSTLLNLLGCLDRPTSGRYFLRDKDVSFLEDNELSEIRLRHLGFVFQSFNILTVNHIKIPFKGKPVTIFDHFRYFVCCVHVH